LDFLAEFQPDVIFFHCWDLWTVDLAMPLVASLRCKSVLVSHGYASHILEISRLPRGLVKWMRWLPYVFTLPIRIRRFNRVVFLSRKTDWGRFFDAKVAQLTNARNTTVIPNGVPEPSVSVPGSFRKTHGIGLGPMFLCIANYCYRKNQERALRAFAAAALPDATLVFIGSELGDYGKRMVAFWNELQAAGAKGRTLFLEGLPRDKTLAALQDCDVKVLAATAETQPIVLLEAMAASKPFISTRTGCVEEFKGGLTVRDTDEMAAAMQRLASSRNERILFGNEGRYEYEKKYSLKITSRAWLNLLSEVTNSG
jgi:glycosyltransferase involved in cell wall biosynthesis